MIDHRADMDRNWKERLERDRLLDAEAARQRDRTERNIMAMIWAGVVTLVGAIAYWVIS